MSQQNNGQGSQPLIKPEQVDGLPFLSPEQKTQYKHGLTQLWQQLDTLPQGSPQHLEVQQKLRTASVKMMQQLASSKNNTNNRPGSQGRPAQLPQNAQTGQPRQAGAGGLNNLPQAVRQELTSMTVNVPSNFLQQGADSANAYRKKFLQHLAALFQRKEAARSRGQNMMQNAQRFSQAGQPVPAEVTQALNEARRDMTQAESEIRTLKLRNEQAGQGVQSSEMQRQSSGAGQQQPSAQQQMNGAQQQPQQQQQQAQQQEMQRQAAMQAANNAQPQQAQGDVKMSAEQQRQTQSPAQPQAGFQQQQNAPVAPTSTPQQTGTQSSAPAKPAQQTPQSATQPQPPQNFPQQQNVPHPQQAQQRPPPINTQALPAQQKPPQQGGPNSAVAQNVGQPQQQQHPMQQQQQQRPQPLSHQAAMSQAAESYSRQQNQPQAPQQPQMPQVPNGLPLAGPPNSAGPSQTPPSAYPPMPSQTNPSTRFPINKTTSIDPRTQVPVPGPPSRPTLGTTGMMQQPGTQRAPIFTLEGEGDRVLSKRKLDELVRQVTGGGEDGALAPDVEEAVLTLADDFVDNVIVSACRLAKLRSSQTLDVRDIQMVLERNYGIRIPGYSLDEMRTVRKFQPAPGWQSKMQAIQAGKVMGNKDS